MRESKETFEIRKKLYPWYEGKNYRKLFEDEFNTILETCYCCDDYKDLISDSKIKNEFTKEWKDNPQNFYATSKAFVFINAASGIVGTGFNALRKFYQHYSGGQILDYGGGAGNCNIIAGGGDYFDLEGIMSDTAAKRFLVRNIKVNMFTEKNFNFDSMYDFIVCSEVLEHINDAMSVIGLICSKINKKGKLLLSYSFNTSDTNVTHLPIYNKKTGKEILKIVKSNGLRLVDKDFKGWVKIFQKIT